MNHLLTCECGREIAVTRKQAGQEIACACGKTLRVPTLRGFAELPVATSANPAGDGSDSRQDQAASAWSGWRGPAIAVASAVFIIAGFATARFLYHRYSVDTSYTIEDEIVAGEELFDQSSPEELSYAWNDYQKLRLAGKDRPWFYRYEKFAQDRERSAMVSGTICLLGGFAAFGIWLTTRSKKS